MDPIQQQTNTSSDIPAQAMPAVFDLDAPIAKNDEVKSVGSIADYFSTPKKEEPAVITPIVSNNVPKIELKPITDSIESIEKDFKAAIEKSPEQTINGGIKPGRGIFELDIERLDMVIGRLTQAIESREMTVRGKMATLKTLRGEIENDIAGIKGLEKEKSLALADKQKIADLHGQELEVEKHLDTYEKDVTGL